MEDKRVIKTKRNLKNTFIRLLGAQPFEKINVTQLCKEAETSRITFYTYYEDKYTLVDEMFDDYNKEALADYYRLQDINNPERNTLKGYFNMLDCIINLYTNNAEFFSLTSSEKNPYLFSVFYHHIFYYVEDYIIRHDANMISKYPPKMTATLLCTGLLSVIGECCKSKTSIQNFAPHIKNMYKDILMSELFVSDKSKVVSIK